MDRQTDGQTVCLGGRMDGWMDGRMDERKDIKINDYIPDSTTYPPALTHKRIRTRTYADMHRRNIPLPLHQGRHLDPVYQAL